LPIKALFKKDLKLSSMLLLILTLIFFIQYPLQMVLEIGRLREMNIVSTDMMISNVFAAGDVLSVLAIIAVIVLGGLLVGSERNTRRHDFSRSLPFSRQKMFAVKAVIGLGAILIIFSLNVFLAYGILWSSEYSGALADFAFLAMYLVPVLAYMAIFSFTLFIGTISGEMISQIALSFIFLIFPFGFLFLLNGFMRIHNLHWLFTEYLNISDGLIMNVVLPFHITDPVRTEKELIIHLSVSVIILIVSLFLGTILYAKGKSERDGEFLLFSSLKPVFLIGIVGCFAMLGGTIFGIFGDPAGAAIPFYWVGALIFGGLSWLITKRLLQMNVTMKNN